MKTCFRVVIPLDIMVTYSVELAFLLDGHMWSDGQETILGYDSRLGDFK